jgi:hypothetical protein
MFFLSFMTMADVDDNLTPTATRNSISGSRFTVSGLMVLIAIAACLLALPTLVSVGVLLASPLVAPFLARRMIAQRQRKLAAYCFGAFAAAINVFYVTSCFTPIYFAIVGLCAGWAILAIAPTIVLGSAWASLATAADAVPRRSLAFAWIVVLLLAVMPLVTLWTLWPIRLLFLAARPEMEQLASQTVAGQRLDEPRSVGLFQLAG